MMIPEGVDQMKIEIQTEQCCVCGGVNDELHSPEEYDAEGAPPLRTVLTKLAGTGRGSAPSNDAKLCENCARRAYDAHDVCVNLAARPTTSLGDRVRSLRRRLQELTEKIDVFIVVGGGSEGNYSEEDIIMVDKNALAAANMMESQDHDRTQNVRGDNVYQCSVCPMSFHRVSDFQTHISSHPPSAVHSCWTCGDQFTSKELLQQHSLQHNYSMLECHLCNTAFQSSSQLRAHEGSCPSVCPCCNLELSSRHELSAHIQESHKEEPLLCCDLCYQVFDQSELLVSHQLTHRQGKQFVCGYQGCILRFASRESLMRHIRKCHTAAPSTSPPPDNSDLVPCPHCTRMFGTVTAMKKHARVHTKLEQDTELESPDENEPVSGEEEGEGEEEITVEYLDMDTLDEDMDQ